ncbi:MAG: polysaccharide export protein [Rhizobiales bacterium]|nr:polysaccharide export protein [Hyphomicrobiales bacterium]
MSVRNLLLAAMALGLSACANTWDDYMPSSQPGGDGVTADGKIVNSLTTGSVAISPAVNESGTVAPFGASGQETAYEFMNGYRVGAGDRLNVRVLDQRELTGQYLVDGAGNISMPLIHTIRVAGLSAPQIEHLIVGRLKNGYLRSPSVSVQVTDLRPFFILGEVQRAGSFPYQAGMTVQNAIALAGGYSPRANQDKVLLTRKTIEGTSTNRVPVTTSVYPGDIVFIRERWF